MARDFYPRQEAAILSFTRNFGDTISLSPGDYGLSVGQCEQYVATQEAFAEAYMIAIDPGTATRSNRAGKDAARVMFEAQTRKLARIIRAQPDVTTQMRINLGLSESDAGEGGAAIARPEQMPRVIVKSVVGREIHIELRDEANKSRKPAGVSGAVLFVMRADEPSANVTDWTFMDISTRTRATLRFGAQFPAGAQVWVMAQWFSTTGARGPASMAVCAYLQGGVVVPANIARKAA